MSSKIILPEKLIGSFEHSVSIDKEKFLAAHQEPAVSSIRLNPFKLSEAFQDADKVPWCTNGRYLNIRPNFTADPLLHAGAYYVQEASSMFLEFALKQLINFEKKIIALDLCAAPGGKSTLLSSLLNDESLLIANEVIQNRATILSENLCKWGKLNTWVTNNDPRHFTSISNLFDIVLVDAPCSGSGLFRKMPDFAEEWNMDLVHLCSQRQERILQDIYPSIKEDGILVYMTCSYSEEENEKMVDTILHEFKMDSCKIDIPTDWNIIETQSEKSKGYGYRFFPHLLRGEGFFLACFKKRKNNDQIKPWDFNKKKSQVQVADSLSKYINIKNKASIVQNENVFLLESAHIPYMEYFSKRLKLIRKGVHCGKIIRNELIPEHDLALYADILKEVNHIELPYTEAIMYLQKEHIEIACPTKGWYLVQYQGHNLGWIKNLGNRINNYYPSNYRILNKNILSD